MLFCIVGYIQCSLICLTSVMHIINCKSVNFLIHLKGKYLFRSSSTLFMVIGANSLCPLLPSSASNLTSHNLHAWFNMCHLAKLGFSSCHDRCLMQIKKFNDEEKKLARNEEVHEN